MTDPLDGYRSRSLWLGQLDRTVGARSQLPGDLECDVAIVGAGFTGLWAAYYLAVLDPALDIVVIEREIVGFGASGRNGGWAAAGIAGSAKTYAKRSGLTAVQRAVEATNDGVDEIGRVVAAESIDCGFAKKGTATLATSKPQADRLRAWFAGEMARGLTSDGEHLMDRAAAAHMVNVPGVEAGFFTPHCASVDPAALAEGLARACEARGVRIFEGTAATSISPHVAQTDQGRVTAPVVLRATESYTCTLPGEKRTYLPLTSLMVATEPLSADVWEELRWAQGLTVRDRHHLFFYAQRSASDRLVIGGRGAPYSLPQPFDEANETNAVVRDRLVRTIRTNFPAAAGAQITHHWGGTLAVPRDWSTSVNFDPVTGLGSAGGYSGHGVVAAHLAGRTLADLVLERASDLVTLPWVGHRSRAWEPEPLRWMAARMIVAASTGADAYEDRSGKRSRRASLIKPFLPPS